jgi:hypothetical protein
MGGIHVDVLAFYHNDMYEFCSITDCVSFLMPGEGSEVYNRVCIHC